MILMAKPTSSFLQIMTERGYIHQASDLDGLDQQLRDNAPASAYIGFDCTANSLHVGSLIQIMMLRRLQETGHRPVILLGEGTTRIGDPSGKDEARKLLNDGEIAKNLVGIRHSFEKFLTFGDGPTDAVLVNNTEWLDELKYIDVLRKIGRHLSVNRMLSMDSVKTRIQREQPLSFLEFNYMVLQAYDFTELFQRHGAILQMGGSDQWGNIITGIDLGRRLGTSQLYGLTSPLLTTSSGKKMGKTSSGAVWLNGDRLSAYDFWQYWRNTEDGDVGRFLRLFTYLPLSEIEKLEALEGAELNEAKKILANTVTEMIHGSLVAEKAAETARKTFEENLAGENLPIFHLTAADMTAGISVVDVLVLTFSVSKSEARRLIRAGGVRMDGEPVQDQNMMITEKKLSNKRIKFSAGKKRHAIVQTGESNRLV